MPRETPNEKIEGLMSNAVDIFDEMRHLSYLNTLPIYFSSSRLNFLRDLSTLIGFLINIVMLATYSTTFDENNEFTAKYVV